jgi:hypothetical protein
MRFFEGEIVYCCDKESPLYGKRLKVDSINEGGKPIFSEMQTGKPVIIDPKLTSDIPPLRKII